MASQRHARVHLVATGIVVFVALWLRIAWRDALWLGAAVTGIWTSEALNTAVELLADRMTLAPDELVRRAKDTAAGAVLVATVFAVGVGLVILGPPIGERLFGS